MARREGDGAGPMNAIIAGFVGLLVVVSIVILGPVLAGSIQNAVPAMPANSPWNTSNSSLNLPNGVSLWTQSVTLGGLVILVFFVALAIYSDVGVGEIPNGIPVLCGSRNYIRVIA